MTKKFRLAALLLSAVMVGSSLAGCSLTKNNTSDMYSEWTEVVTRPGETLPTDGDGNTYVTDKDGQTKRVTKTTKKNSSGNENKDNNANNGNGNIDVTHTTRKPGSPTLDFTPVADKGANYDVKGTVTIAVDTARPTDYDAMFDVMQKLYPNVKIKFDYHKLIDGNDAVAGAFIWEWCDQGIYLGDTADGQPKYAYGGDFGELVNDGNFCIDGMVLPDRRLHAGALEAKNVHRPVRITRTENGYLFRNMLDFAPIDEQYTFRCTVADNGRVLDERQITLILPPRQSCTVAIPEAEGVQGNHVTLDIDILRDGQEVGFEQFTLCQAKPVLPAAAKGTVQEEDDRFILIVDAITVTISKRSGMIVSFMRDGRELLAKPMQLNAYRAPLDNDCNIRDNWKKIFADRMIPKIYRIESDGDRVSCHLAMGYSSYEPVCRAKIEYAPCAGGITVAIHATVNEKLRYLPRFGVRLFVRRDMEQLDYLGYGPQESYIDKRNAAKFGRYRSTVDEQYTCCIRPQESGSHYGCDRLTVCGGGDSLNVTADRAFSFSCLGYTQEELTEKKHDWELVRYPASVLCVDYKMTGVGSQSCGPEILEEYKLSEKTIDFTVALTK